MESRLAGLHIDLPARSKPKSSRRDEEVAESWEDDDIASPVESGSDTQTPTESPGLSLQTSRSRDPALNPPPPTPISPGNGRQYIDWAPAGVLGGGRPTSFSQPSPSAPFADAERERKRPEKTTATASRLIAQGLGMKVPKKSEETKQYERALREKEVKRRTKEKEDQKKEREAEERLKAAVWDG